jgi:hypothetical protein
MICPWCGAKNEPVPATKIGVLKPRVKRYWTDRFCIGRDSPQDSYLTTYVNESSPRFSVEICGLVFKDCFRLRGLEPVACASNGSDISGILGIALDLLAQPANVYIHGTGSDILGIAPNGVQ